MNTYKFKLQNLKCGGCASTITKKISEVKDISNVKVDVEEATVTFDGNESLPEIVKLKLANIGYPLDDELNTTLQKAKSYVSCMVGRMGN